MLTSLTVVIISQNIHKYSNIKLHTWNIMLYVKLNKTLKSPFGTDADV